MVILCMADIGDSAGVAFDVRSVEGAMRLRGKDSEVHESLATSDSKTRGCELLTRREVQDRLTHKAWGW